MSATRLLDLVDDGDKELASTKLSDLRLITVLGQGAFGTVKLMKHLPVR